MATLPKLVTLAAVVREAAGTASDMLGLATAPDLAVFADRKYQQGVRVGPGRRLGAVELSGTVIGERIPSAVHFEIDVPATGDGVFLMVVDDPDEQPYAVFSPYRNCVGVAVASFLALATARLAGGEYLDDEIQMLVPARTDPDDVVNRTRLSGPGADFATRCEEYLRQFERLNGWPYARSAS